jgi:hypothetical protein
MPSTFMALASRKLLTEFIDERTDLIRQPRDGFSSIRFGFSTLENMGELDRFCQVPKAAYALCVADM